MSAHDVRVEVAAHGSQRLLVGAAVLAWDALIADPLSLVGEPRDGTSFAALAP